MAKAKIDRATMMRLRDKSRAALAKAVHPEPEAAKCSLGIEDTPQGWRIIFRADDSALSLDADMADQLSADLRQYAVELRTGGRLT